MHGENEPLSLPYWCPTIIKDNIDNANMASLNVTDRGNNTSSNELTKQQAEILEYSDI